MNRRNAAHIIFAIVLSANGVSLSFPVKNTTPVVKIKKPVAGKFSQLNKFIGFEIDVSDKEDGESRYEEIPENEVFLEVHYFKQYAAAEKFRNKSVEHEDPGLTAIKRSDCLNCHQVRNKLIGPSFYNISEKYRGRPKDLKAVARHIMEGSSRIWGETTMPSHPDISPAIAESIVNWINYNTKDSTFDIQRGLRGSFSTCMPSGCVIALKATYLDHGLNGLDSTRRWGADIVIISSE